MPTNLLDRLLATLAGHLHAFSVCEIQDGWRLAFPPFDAIIVHCVLKGGGSLRVGNGPWHPFASQSIVVVPPCRSHALGDPGPAARESCGEEHCSLLGDGLVAFTAGDGRRDTLLACGTVTAPRGGALGLFDLLREPVVEDLSSSGVHRQVFDLMLAEVTSPGLGMQAMTEALMQQCLILLLRRHLLRNDGNGSPLSTALHHPRLAHAVAAVLENPAAPHSVESSGVARRDEPDLLRRAVLAGVPTGTDRLRPEDAPRHRRAPPHDDGPTGQGRCEQHRIREPQLLLPRLSRCLRRRPEHLPRRAVRRRRSTLGSCPGVRRRCFIVQPRAGCGTGVTPDPFGAQPLRSSHMAESVVAPPASPLRYDPAVEHPEKDEGDTDRELVETLLKISSTTFADGGHALRSVHAKSHGLLRGELRVLDTLPAVLVQGAFARPGTYPVVIRLSTTPGDILDDSVSTPRGMALKIVGVAGERLPGTEGDATQDFVLVNGPAFNAPTARKFLGSLKLLAATTDKAEGAKKVASAALRGAEAVVEAFGGKSPTLTSLGGQPETNILGETFYSQAPLLWGPYMAKVCIAPVSPELTALTDAPLDVNGKPNGIREAVVDFFRQNGAEWELRVQLCTDLDTMPIEDASVPWPEDQSPYVPVARIFVPPQDAWSEARSVAVDDGLAFSPWHGLAAHRPLGSIMRARKAAYEMSAQFRAKNNKHPIEEPRTPADLPG